MGNQKAEEMTYANSNLELEKEADSVENLGYDNPSLDVCEVFKRLNLFMLNFSLCEFNKMNFCSQ